MFNGVTDCALSIILAVLVWNWLMHTKLVSRRLITDDSFYTRLVCGCWLNEWYVNTRFFAWFPLILPLEKVFPLERLLATAVVTINIGLAEVLKHCTFILEVIGQNFIMLEALGHWLSRFVVKKLVHLAMVTQLIYWLLWLIRLNHVLGDNWHPQTIYILCRFFY